PSMEAWPRRPVMMISRPRMTNTIHAGTRLYGRIIINAVMTISLSAIGSRNFPKTVTIPMRRARYPSSQSVMEAMANITAAQKPADLEGEKRTVTRTGMEAIRSRVRILGMFQIALLFSRGMGHSRCWTLMQRKVGGRFYWYDFLYCKTLLT